jgi:hypothetical protein
VYSNGRGRLREGSGLQRRNADNKDDLSDPSGQFFIGDEQAEGEVTCLTVFPTSSAGSSRWKPRLP